MPFDIDGAGRSSTHACLPTAWGTVAPTRGQEEFSSGPVLVPYNLVVEAVGGRAGFFQGGSWGCLGRPGPPLRANSGPGALRARRGVGGFKFLHTHKHPTTKKRDRCRPLSRGPSTKTGLTGHFARLGDWAGPALWAKPFHQQDQKVARLLQTSFSRSEPSAYTNEKVLLLTKMDLTEFRS